MKPHASFAFVVVLAFFASACGKPETIEEHPCPPGGTTLTFQNFGQSFLNTNCQSCHAAHAVDRYGAPGGYSFDTRDDVVRLKARIFARAADSNTSMPPGPTDPSMDDRIKLADWLACGAN